LFRLARLGCCSAIISPLPLLRPSPFGVPFSPWSAAPGFLGVVDSVAFVLAVWLVLAVKPDGSSARARSGLWLLRSLLLVIVSEAARCGGGMRCEKVRM
jgi:hypothetical protein